MQNNFSYLNLALKIETKIYREKKKKMSKRKE